MAIRIVLVDDHQMVRIGLATLIAGFEDLELIGEATNGTEAIRLCETQQPDVVLMDLMMPGVSGVEATRVIRKSCPGTQIVALTSFKDEELVQEVLEAGAIGYILKDANVDTLVKAIRAARAQQPTLDWQATQALIRAKTRPSPPIYDLTPREIEILTLLVQGLTNRQIAQELNISRHTVNAHVSGILSKMGAASRTEAVSLALKHNLVNQ